MKNFLEQLKSNSIAFPESVEALKNLKDFNSAEFFQFLNDNEETLKDNGHTLCKLIVSMHAEEKDDPRFEVGRDAFEFINFGPGGDWWLEVKDSTDREKYAAVYQMIDIFRKKDLYPCQGGCCGCGC